MLEEIAEKWQDKKGVVVYNPIAGRQLATKKVKKIMPSFGKRVKKVTLVESNKNCPLKKAKVAVKNKNPDFVVVVAGDGTVNAWANAILTQAPSTLLLIKSAGSGNDLSFSLAEHKRQYKIDVGYIKEKNRYFVNCLDIGFAAKVAKKANKSLRQLRSLSLLPNSLKPHWAYLKAALFTLPKYRSQKYSVVLKNENAEIRKEGRYLMIGTLNGRREGKIFTTAPDASLTDGLLNVNLIQEIPVFKRIYCLLRAINGSQRSLRYVDYRTVSQIKIEADRKFSIQADGEEWRPEKKLTIQVKKKKLKVIKI